MNCQVLRCWHLHTYYWQYTQITSILGFTQITTPFNCKPNFMPFYTSINTIPKARPQFCPMVILSLCIVLSSGSGEDSWEQMWNDTFSFRCHLRVSVPVSFEGFGWCGELAEQVWTWERHLSSSRLKSCNSNLLWGGKNHCWLHNRDNILSVKEGKKKNECST